MDSASMPHARTADEGRSDRLAAELGLGRNDSAYQSHRIYASMPHARIADEERQRLSKDVLLELRKENASLRSRLKGVNVLSTLLSEAREEIANLNAQKNKQEIAVENLQSRLHRLGADSSVDLADHEIYMPGHDKQFLNSLISENMRLQKALKNGRVTKDAVVKDEQQAQVRILEQQLDQLKKENARRTEQLKEVIGMNARWQRYNGQREAYIIKLNKSIYQLQSKITVYEQQISDLTKSNEELKKENEQLKQEDQDKRDAALCSADQQLAIKDEEIQELKEQVKDMKDLVEAVSSQHTSPFDEYDRERIKMLEQQITTFASDFKDKRRDTECIQDLYAKALNELEEKDRYIEFLLRQLRQRSPVTPVAAYRAPGPQYAPSSNSRIAFQPSSTAKVRQPSSAIGAAEYSPHGSKARSLVSNANGRSPMQAPDMDRQQYYMYGEEFLDIPGDEGIDGGAPRGAYGGPRYSPYNRQSRVTTSASDFQDERRDRESFQGLYTDALKELQEKDRYIEDLQRQVRQRSPVTPVAAYGVPQYTPYNRQSSNFRQAFVASGMVRQQYYGEDFPDLPRDAEIDGGAPRAHDMPDGTTGLDGDDF